MSGGSADIAPLKLVLSLALLLMGMQACSAATGYSQPREALLGGNATDWQASAIAASTSAADLKLLQSLTVELDRLLANCAAGNSSSKTTSDIDSRAVALDLSYESTTRLMQWKYNNVGDYNLDLVVDHRDLMPLGMVFGAITGDGIGHDELEFWICVSKYPGSQISMQSILPIGMNYGREAASEYILLAEHTLKPSEVPQELGRFTMADSIPGWPPRFEFQLPEGCGRYLYLEEYHAGDSQPHKYWYNTGYPEGLWYEDYVSPNDGQTYSGLPGVALVYFNYENNHPLVQAWLVTENLEASDYAQPSKALLVYFPEGQTLNDAINNWPLEYPHLIFLVRPESIGIQPQ